MGKRELLIVVAFVAVGALLYRLTAPPVRQDRGFSLGRLIDEIRADIRSDATSATVTHASTIEVPATLEEVRLSGITGQIVVTGEERADIAFELEVQSTGPDEQTATEYARRTVLVEDDLGETLGLRVSYPPEARQNTAITVRVPQRLRVRVEGGSSRGNSGEFRDIGSLRLEGVIGEVTAERIAGEVSGSHRNGRLMVTDAGSVVLTLLGSRAEISGVREHISLNASRGETRISGSTGPVKIELSNTELTIEENEGGVEVGGSGGQVDIVDPRAEVTVDVRRSEVTVTLARPVPVTVITTDEPLRLLLDGPPSIVVDAVITGNGDLIAEEFGLTATEGQDERSLMHAFGKEATVRVALRNRRDDIVIRNRK